MERSAGARRGGSRPAQFRAATEAVAFESEGERVSGAFTLPRYGMPRGTVLFLHGLLSSREEFDEFPLWISDEGYASLAFDFRGHGSSAGPRSLVSEARHVADVRAALRFLADSGRLRGPVALVGHSLGGLVALAAAATPDLAPSVRCVAALAPPLAIRDEVRGLERAGYAALYGLDLLTRRLRFDLAVPYKARYGDLFASPEAAERARRRGFLQERVRVANYPHLMRLDARRFAPGVRAPVLVLAGAEDRFVLPARSRAVHDALPGERAWAEVPGSGHSMMMDQAAGEVFERLVAWLDRWMA